MMKSMAAIVRSLSVDVKDVNAYSQERVDLLGESEDAQLAAKQLMEEPIKHYYITDSIYRPGQPLTRDQYSWLYWLFEQFGMFQPGSQEPYYTIKHGHSNHGNGLRMEWKLQTHRFPDELSKRPIFPCMQELGILLCYNKDQKVIVTIRTLSIVPMRSQDAEERVDVLNGTATFEGSSVGPMKDWIPAFSILFNCNIPISKNE